MKRYFAFPMAIVVAMLVAGCGGKGSSAPAPTGVTVTPGDTSVTVKWNMLPGVQYWVWGAPGSNVTTQNCTGTQGCVINGVNSGAVSGVVITGLTNGTAYSFSINGRTGGGPGGPGSASVPATPRLAGATWNAGTPLAQDLHGMAYGVPTGGATGVLVAAGANGSLFSRPDGMSWGAQLTNLVPVAPRINFNGITFNAATYYSGQFLVVGTGGVILRSTDAVTWTQQTSNTSNDLYAVSNYGVAGFVATGANGTILTSIDGISWTSKTSNTSNALYGVTYANANGKYVAVGAAGTLLTSTDGATWTPVTPALSPAFDLKGVAYGVPQLTYDSTFTTLLPAATFVAVGANGTLVTSPDGASWTTSSTPVSSTLLNAVTFGHQFIAIDDTGNIYNSKNGLSWTTVSAVNNTNTKPLYAVLPTLYASGSSANQFVYSVVGASGVNMLAE